MEVSAGMVVGQFLEPALDARAWNLREGRLLFDPSPEPDSLVELLMLAAGSSRLSQEVRRVLAAAVPLARRAAAANLQEGGREVALCGAADRLARDLRGRELAGRGGVLKAKAIAAALRAPLAAIEAYPATDGLTFVDAVRAVDLVLERVPSAQLLAPAVEHELRARKFVLLRELIDRRRGADSLLNGGRRRACDAAGVLLTTTSDRAREWL